MIKYFGSLTLLVAFSTLVSCSGRTSVGTAPIPNIAGQWEFIAISNVDSTQTGIEVALKEGQTIVDGAQQPNGSISASGTQMMFITIDPNQANISAFGGSCAAGSDQTNSLTGSIIAADGPLNFNYTQNGSANTFSVTGTLSGDGTSLLNGTYTSQAGGSCVDNGTITGKIVAKLSGMYTGQLSFPNETDNVSATLSPSGGTLTLNLVATRSDNTTFTLSLTGPITGNAFTVTGTYQGNVITFQGYWELTYDSLTLVNDIPSLYMVNAATPSQPGDLLRVPQTQTQARK